MVLKKAKLLFRLILGRRGRYGFSKTVQRCCFSFEKISLKEHKNSKYFWFWIKNSAADDENMILKPLQYFCCFIDFFIFKLKQCLIHFLNRKRMSSPANAWKQQFFRFKNISNGFDKNSPFFRPSLGWAITSSDQLNIHNCCLHLFTWFSGNTILWILFKIW